MRLSSIISVEDPRKEFEGMFAPELAGGKIKDAKVSLSHEKGTTRITLESNDVTSMRASLSAVMSAMRVFDGMKEACSDGDDPRD